MHHITGEVLRDNYGILRASRNVGFEIRSRGGDGIGGTLEAYIVLGGEEGRS